MKLHESSAIRVGIVVTALAAAPLEADAGGARTKSYAQYGHRVPHHGVASFYRNSRNLPDGVGIFNRRPSSSHAHVAKPQKHAGRKPLHTNGFSHSKPGTMEKDGARRTARLASKGGLNDSKKRKERRGHSQHAKKGHKRHEKKQVLYAPPVYVAAPAEELYYPEQPDDENCRSLIERGYDLSGRRVLVEWTLCFDDRGETYVPENGRRIVARY